MLDVFVEGTAAPALRLDLVGIAAAEVVETRKRRAPRWGIVLFVVLVRFDLVETHVDLLFVPALPLQEGLNLPLDEAHRFDEVRSKRFCGALAHAADACFRLVH